MGVGRRVRSVEVEGLVTCCICSSQVTSPSTAQDVSSSPGGVEGATGEAMSDYASVSPPDYAWVGASVSPPASAVSPHGAAVESRATHGARASRHDAPVPHHGAADSRRANSRRAAAVSPHRAPVSYHAFESGGAEQSLGGTTEQLVHIYGAAGPSVSYHATAVESRATHGAQQSVIDGKVARVDEEVGHSGWAIDGEAMSDYPRLADSVGAYRRNSVGAVHIAKATSPLPNNKGEGSGVREQSIGAVHIAKDTPSLPSATLGKARTPPSGP